jgi:hypothetical protein
MRLSFFKRKSKPPAICECGKYRALFFFDGRSLCFECRQLWLDKLEISDRKASPAEPAGVCECCGEFQSSVRVDGRALCIYCHDKWLIEHGFDLPLPGGSGASLHSAVGRVKSICR